MLGLSVAAGSAASSSTSAPSTKSAKYRDLMSEVLQACLSSGDGVQINLDAIEIGQLFWHGQVVSYECVPQVDVVREMLWELNELNFRLEFLALDLRARNHAISTTSRDDLILACFPGAIGGSLLVLDFGLVDQGLAAENCTGRVTYLIALKNVMKSWRGFNEAVKRCRHVDLAANKEPGEFSDAEVVAMDAALAQFYTQTFFDFFGRAAIIPRRLPHKCLH